MALSKEEVQKVAKLARIELTQEEVEKFQTQLSDILDYIDKLQEVNTDNVETTAQVTGLENVLREDAIKGCPEDEREAALNQAPELAANFVKVKSVF
jgi:aspartyl-tRNA(Asn)/glutamyl-tRNA(Gln) amidotransferase subunit C